MSDPDVKHRTDHIVVVVFENRSFDNLLGYLYQPGEKSSFEGVSGRNLTNPIPGYADGAERGVVPVHPAANLDSPAPDPGEEYPHVNTQLFRTIDPEKNRFSDVDEMQPPYNAPLDSALEPTMGGFVTDYVNEFRVRMNRPPRYDEYAQIMACHTPEQLPVLSTLAKGFACFDHWFSEVPSQTYTNRSFLHAGSASGMVLNSPPGNFPAHNDAETIFDRLDSFQIPWKVYIDPIQIVSATGLIHASRLEPQFATHFFSINEFYENAKQGTLTDYTFI